MPSDYAAIRREKSEDYIELAERVSRDLVSRLYGDRAHFVFELLQNAEDALSKRDGHGGSRRVCFTLDGDVVRFSHFGKLFDEEDVRSVCDLLRSTKHEMTEIGRFGIGFKSVGAMTDRPKIHSGDEHFEIRRYVLPFAVPSVGLESGETSIVLPLREADDHAEVESELAGLDARTLLFLREIDEIEWSVEGGRYGRYRREEHREGEGEGVRRVRLLGEADGRDPVEEAWLIFSREVRNDGEPAGYVELAFKISRDDAGREIIEPIRDSRLVVFFPTVIPTNLGMLMQGPYQTTPSRDNISWQEGWNRYLVEETAGLLADTLLHLRDRRLLTPRAFGVLPLSRPLFPDGNRFAPLFEAVHEAIATEPLLPAYRGGPVPASQAALARGKGLRDLMSRQQLAELLGEDEPVAWLSGEITRSATPELHRYLTSEHGLKEFGTSNLLRLLSDDEEFLEAQTDAWIQKLYAFLGREDVDSYDYPLDDVPLIRLEDGTHIWPGWGAEPVAFLPTDPPSGYPNTVRSSVCKSGPALEFLRSLGLSEPDQVDKLARNILPKYGEGSGIRQREYAVHLRHFLEVFGSREQRGRLTDMLRETLFVQAVDAGTGAISFVRPADVYVGLDALFNGVEGVLVARQAAARCAPTRDNRAAGGLWRFADVGSPRVGEVACLQGRRGLDSEQILEPVRHHLRTPAEDPQGGASREDHERQHGSRDQSGVPRAECAAGAPPDRAC